MKKLVTLLAAAAVLIGCLTATTPLQEDPEIVRIVEADRTKDELYRLSNEWMVEVFTAADEVIEYSDKAEGVLMGKGFVEKFINLGTWHVWYTIKIEAKEGKARISIYDFRLTVIAAGESSDVGKIAYQEQWDQVSQEMNAIAADYEKYIAAAADSAW